MSEEQERLDDILRQDPLASRPTAEYQALLEPTETNDDRLVEGAIILKVKGKSYRAPKIKTSDENQNEN